MYGKRIQSWCFLVRWFKRYTFQNWENYSYICIIKILYMWETGEENVWTLNSTRHSCDVVLFHPPHSFKPHQERAFVFSLSLCIALMQASHSLQSAAMSSAVLPGEIWADNSHTPQCSSSLIQGWCFSSQIQLKTAFWPSLVSVHALSHTAGMPADLYSDWEWEGGRKLEQRQRWDFEGNTWKNLIETAWVCWHRLCRYTTHSFYFTSFYQWWKNYSHP